MRSLSLSFACVRACAHKTLNEECNPTHYVLYKLDIALHIFPPLPSSFVLCFEFISQQVSFVAQAGTLYLAKMMTMNIWPSYLLLPSMCQHICSPSPSCLKRESFSTAQANLKLNYVAQVGLEHNSNPLASVSKVLGFQVWVIIPKFPSWHYGTKLYFFQLIIVVVLDIWSYFISCTRIFYFFFLNQAPILKQPQWWASSPSLCDSSVVNLRGDSYQRPQSL